MTTRTKVLEVAGTQVQQTAERLGDRIIRAIFVVEEKVDSAVPDAVRPAKDSIHEVEALLAEMDAHAVRAGDLDDSREAIYTRLEGE